MDKPRAVPMSNAVLRLFELQIIRDSRPLSAMVLAIYSAVRHLSPAKRAARRANPKDFAYSVYREWGPKSRIPRPERLWRGPARCARGVAVGFRSGRQACVGHRRSWGASDFG